MTDTPLFAMLRDAIRAEAPIALATVIEGPHLGAKMLVGPDNTDGSLGDDDLDRVVSRDVLGELAAGRTGIRRYGAQGQARADDVSVFIESFAPPPQMLIFGAVDFTAALARVAKFLGYRVTVCDARPMFATKKRFPFADDVVVDWPNRLLDEVGPMLRERDAIAVLTHDAKFDIPAITSALLTEVGYIGVMGSRRTHDDRTKRLIDAGVTSEELERLRSPIGIDLGGRTPEETAVSIVAEIIALRTGRIVPALRDADGPIHR
ncbi:MAG: xanthine dehydrogenase accessory factor [Verrucomicrobiales bacterium]